MIPIDDDVFPDQRPRTRSRLRAATAVTGALVVVSAAIAGVVAWTQPDDRPQNAAPAEPAVPEDTAPDRTEEVLGEVFERADATTTSTAAPTTTAPARRTSDSTTTTTRRRTTTTASSNTTTSTTTRPTNAPPPVDLTVSAEGDVFIEQYFSPETRERYEPNPDCGNLHEFYEVVVYDEEGNVLAEAALTDGTYEREDDADGGTTTRCTYDYRVAVPEADTYVFTLAEASNHDAIEDSETVSDDQLREEGAPTLRISRRYCPEC